MARKIEVSQPQDAQRLQTIWSQSVEATHHFLSKQDLKAIHRELAELNFFALSHWIVRDDDGEIAGFLYTDNKKIEALFVHPNYLGQGFGRDLMLFALDSLGTNQVDVNEANASALSFYQKFGFKVTARSALDSAGRPYPLLNLSLKDA